MAQPARRPPPARGAELSPGERGAETATGVAPAMTKKPDKDDFSWQGLAETRLARLQERSERSLENDVRTLVGKFGKGNPFLFLVAIFSLAAEIAAVLKKAGQGMRRSRLLSRLKELVSSADSVTKAALEGLAEDPTVLPPSVREAIRQMDLFPAKQQAALTDEQRRDVQLYMQLMKRLMGDQLDDACVNDVLQRYAAFTAQQRDDLRPLLRHLLLKTPKKMSKLAHARLSAVLDRPEPHTARDLRG